MQGDHPSAPGPNTDPDHRRTSGRTLQCGRKAVDAVDEKAGQGRGKDVERKSHKTHFPSQPANPAYCAGFTLSHRLLRLTINQTGHFICYQKRTFSLANDTSGSATIRPKPPRQHTREELLLRYRRRL